MAVDMMKVFAKAYVCKGSASPDEAKKEFASLNPGSIVQTGSAESAKNEFFVEMLAAQTLRAGSVGGLLAKKPEMDFLLRLAGTTQISRAIKQYGSTKGVPFLLVVAGPREIRESRSFKAMELPRRKLSKKELDRIEGAALLSALRP
ncbi:MAG TPA: KEOPS complex subunit Cgi121 [Nitrososphaerales archaeon]|nr:KEOPS complex subunit Cgi121 [Nitrososphaerales archaeon]